MPNGGTHDEIEEAQRRQLERVRFLQRAQWRVEQAREDLAQAGEAPGVHARKDCDALLRSIQRCLDLERGQ